MQSILQYRRLRREVQEDLEYARKSNGSTGSPTDNSAGTPNGSTALGPEAAVEKNSTQSADTLMVPGVTVSRSHDEDGSVTFVVGWKENDPNNPQDWTLTKKWIVMCTCSILAISLTLPSSVEGPTQDAFNKHFGVEPMAGSMTTGKNLPCKPI